MLIEERKNYIVQLLESQSSVTVKDLSAKFGMSEVSVRKLLMQMEQDGLLRRCWGGAVRCSNVSQELAYTDKENRRLEEKRSIAYAAYDQIKDGETVYVDCGTTSFQLAKLIVEGDKKLVVCTNAFNILAELRKRPDIQAIMIGGELRPAIYSCVGFLAVRMLEMIVVDRAFITGDHFSLEHGFSVSNMQDLQVKQSVLKSAKRNYVIMDSSKYGDDSMAVFAPLGVAKNLITDWHLSEEICGRFESLGTRVIRAQEKTYKTIF